MGRLLPGTPSVCAKRSVDGLAADACRSSQGMPKSVKGARIACLDMNLQKARMLFGVQVGARGGGAAAATGLPALPAAGPVISACCSLPA